MQFTQHRALNTYNGLNSSTQRIKLQIEVYSITKAAKNLIVKVKDPIAKFEDQIAISEKFKGRINCKIYSDLRRNQEIILNVQPTAINFQKHTSKIGSKSGPFMRRNRRIHHTTCGDFAAQIMIRGSLFWPMMRSHV